LIIARFSCYEYRMKMHLTPKMIEEFRIVKEQHEDSWRFAFRVYKRMRTKKINYEAAKQELIEISVRREEQLKLNERRKKEKLGVGFSEIKKKDLDLLRVDNKSEDILVPISVQTHDQRMVGFYETFIMCMRYGYDCVDFGLESEKFFFYDGLSIKMFRYRQDPIGYASSIAGWIRQSEKCGRKQLVAFSKAFDFQYDEVFLDLMCSVFVDRKILAFDYREDCEVLLDFISKGYSARNVGFDGEVVYYYSDVREDDDGDVGFFRIKKEDQDYEEMVPVILRCPKPLKFERVIEQFVVDFGVDMDEFQKVYNVLSKLVGGSFVNVSFSQGSFVIYVTGEISSGCSVYFGLRDVLESSAIRCNLTKSDYLRMVAFSSRLVVFSMEYYEPSPGVEVDMFLSGCYGSQRSKGSFLTTLGSDYDGSEIEKGRASIIVKEGIVKYSLRFVYRYQELGSFSVVSTRKSHSQRFRNGRKSKRNKIG